MINPKNTYDIETMLATYLRAKKKLGDWFVDQIFNLQLNMAKEAKQEEIFKKAFEEKKEELLNGISPYFTYSARDLYEFFDENKLFIQIYEKNGEFIYEINNEENTNAFPSRWEAEKNAFNLAFELLERKV